MDSDTFSGRLEEAFAVFQTAVRNARPPHAEALIDGAQRLKIRLAVIAECNEEFDAADLLASACTQAGQLRLEPYVDAGARAFIAVLWHHAGTNGLDVSPASRQFMAQRVAVDGQGAIGQEKWSIVTSIVAIEHALNWLAVRQPMPAAA